MEIVYRGKWGKARHNYPCAPLEIRPQQVHWYGANWYLPAVYACAPDRLAEPIRDEASLWPREFCVLRYTVTPALPGEIQLQPADRSQGDPPRRPGKAEGSVVIGGAAAVCLLQPKEDVERAAASALYFEPPQSVAWRLRLSGTPDVGQADLCLL